LSALATVAGAINAARAADYPTRPIKLIVPYPAGGPTDVLGRMVADFLTRDLKQTVFVENKGGAQGAIGAEAAARAEPDGYTLFFTVASIVVLNPVLYKKLAYDPDRDFRVLAIVTDSPVVMVVHPSVPAKSVAEFVAYAKQNPGKLNFGSAGTGGTIHLAGEMFRQMAGIEMTHVPYKGTFTSSGIVAASACIVPNLLWCRKKLAGARQALGCRVLPLFPTPTRSESLKCPSSCVRPTSKAPVHASS